MATIAQLPPSSCFEAIFVGASGNPDVEGKELKANVEDAFSRFATGRGYELRGIALCAVAS